MEVKILMEKVVMTEKCCLNCANILSCPDILTYQCKKYLKTELDKEALSAKYHEVLQKIADFIKELQVAEMGLKIDETRKKYENTPARITEAEQKEVKVQEEKPAISKRNKEIVKLIEQGKGIKEVAEVLNLKPETVALEVGYLAKNGLIKANPS
jgi:DNA-binding NarL/FixJ family response regulator